MDKVKNVLMLQGVVIIYSISTVMSKLASGEKGIKFIMFFGLEFVFLGIYALLWQQMIKKFELTVAYANRAMVIIWSTVWAVVFFHNHITVKNVAGILLVMLGTFLVNTEKEARDDK